METEEEAIDHGPGIVSGKQLKWIQIDKRCKQLEEGIDSDTPFAKDLVSLCYRPR